MKAIMGSIAIQTRKQMDGATMLDMAKDPEKTMALNECLNQRMASLKSSEGYFLKCQQEIQAMIG